VAKPFFLFFILFHFNLTVCILNVFQTFYLCKGCVQLVSSHINMFSLLKEKKLYLVINEDKARPQRRPLGRNILQFRKLAKTSWHES
jgi:hypothetical protein